LRLARFAAQTFHALAYDIIGNVEGSKPELAEHASDVLAYTNVLRGILIGLLRCSTSDNWQSDIQFELGALFPHLANPRQIRFSLWPSALGEKV
jgi:hypothetical protein